MDYLNALSVVHLVGHDMSSFVPSVASGILGPGEAAKSPYDPYLAPFLNALIFLANLGGGLVIGIAVLRGIFLFLVDMTRARGQSSDVPKEAIRISLGRSFALGLEFQLGADILATALNPSASDLIVLGAIIALRTILNFFLGRELAQATKREAQRRALAETEPQAKSGMRAAG